MNPVSFPADVAAACANFARTFVTTFSTKPQPLSSLLMFTTDLTTVTHSIIIILHHCLIDFGLYKKYLPKLYFFELVCRPQTFSIDSRNKRALYVSAGLCMRLQDDIYRVRACYILRAIVLPRKISVVRQSRRIFSPVLRWWQLRRWEQPCTCRVNKDSASVA